MSPSAILSISGHIALFLLSAAFLMTIVRVIRGPTLPDRVVGLDMLVATAIGFIAVIAVKTGYGGYVDIAIALGLVGFLSTVAFARFVLSQAPPREDGPEKEAPGTPALEKAAIPAGADRPKKSKPSKRRRR